MQVRVVVGGIAVLTGALSAVAPDSSASDRATGPADQGELMHYSPALRLGRAEALGRPAVRACQHEPPCPAAGAIAIHPEQGWSLLCNGVITFDDTGELLPDGTPIEPRPGPRHTVGKGLRSDGQTRS